MSLHNNTKKTKKPGHSLAVAFDFALSAANNDFNKNLERSTSYAFMLRSILLLVSSLRSILLLVSWSTMSWELLRSNLAPPKQS